MDPNEYQIWKTGKAQGKSDSFIRSAILAHRASATAPAPTAPAPTPPPAPNKNGLITDRGLVGNFVGNVANAGKKVANFLTGAEQAVGGELAAGLPASITGEKQLNQANQDLASADLNFIKTIKARQAAGISLTKQQMDLYNHILETNSSVGTQTDLLPHAADTNAQALGNVAGVAADVLTAGNYSAGARGATSFARYTAQPVQQVAKQTLGQIGRQTAVRSAAGAATGYAYDVSGNLQNGKTGTEAFTPGVGTLTGAAVPLLIGGIRAGVAITKEQAPRFINSLIKPKTADFSYGKDPGRTVSELGITGNNISDFEQNITTAKRGIGQQLGEIYSSPANAGVRINATDDIARIDAAIKEAAKGGKNNQTIVTQLQNVKDAILYEHGIDANGAISRVGDVPRDLSKLSAEEAQNLIQHVADQTQFTGRHSDDKVVNATLKNIYGGIREKINTGVGINNPEIEKLNQQYADLTSAEIATRNRDKIIQRSNLISLPAGGAAGAGAIVTAIVTGGAAIPAILGGATALAVEKAFESTAVKTRVAAWLGKQSAGAISAFLQKNPNLGPVLNRVFPAIMSKLTR